MGSRHYRRRDPVGVWSGGQPIEVGLRHAARSLRLLLLCRGTNRELGQVQATAEPTRVRWCALHCCRRGYHPILENLERTLDGRMERAAFSSGLAHRISRYEVTSWSRPRMLSFAVLIFRKRSRHSYI